VGALDELIRGLPAESQEAAESASPDARVWTLWLEAVRCKRAGGFAPARAALRTADEVAEQLGWTVETAPVWQIESAGLHAKLDQDDGEGGQAFGALQWALQGWLNLGEAFTTGGAANPALAGAAAREAEMMITSLLGMPASHDALQVWMVDRLVPETGELAARMVGLTADVQSFGDARRLVNDLLAAIRGWELPTRDALGLEIRLQQALVAAAEGARLFDKALALAGDTLALVSRLPEGTRRTRLEAEARTNRANTLFVLRRAEEAAREYDVADRMFVELGAEVDALLPRIGSLRARSDAGDVSTDSVVRLLRDVERATETAEGRSNGTLMGSVEFLRRWYLSLLAEHGSDDLEEIVALIELIRGDRPLMRDGRDHEDAVVARLCRPFTLLGARLTALPDTVLLVFEPRMFGARPRPCVFLTVSAGDGDGLRWRLSAGGDTTEPALTELARVAAREQERLATREIPVRSEPSTALTEAAEHAWAMLPAEVRAALMAARTILYLPSSAGALDTIPLELFRHEEGWLGATHVVARFPSFQLLETLLAPYARWPADDDQASLVQVAVDPHLDALAAAEQDMQTAQRAATVLGLRPERREISTEAEGLSVFTQGALVHYVGHGFAGELGEFLPLSGHAAVSATALDEADASDTPFVFFNACLLGRVRRLSGGRQKGWALTLLERGAPAVVGALHAVPDDACPLVAEAFYRGAWKAPVGEGMRQARARLGGQGVNPLVYGAYVLHGDPNAVVSRTLPDGPRSTRDLATGWPAQLTRFLATQLPAQRDALLEAIAGDATLSPVSDWLDGAADGAALARAVDGLLERDPEGAAACRMLLALERIRGASPEDAATEFETAYLVASALDDSYAMLFLLAKHGRLWAPAEDEHGPAVLTTAVALLQLLGADKPSLASLVDGLRDPSAVG
jgi:CHAT domain-containing protein